MPIDRNLVAATISPLAFDFDELTALVGALERPAQPAIRLRPGVDTGRLPFATTGVKWHPQGQFIAGDMRPGANLEFAVGDYYIQDAASLLAVALLHPQPGETICDLCAAPGGKTTSILESLGDSGWLLANEAVQSRRGMLEFNLARHGSTRYFVSSFDPDELARRLPSRFDAVLVDAPCSGQSLVGRGKQTVSSFAATTVEHCAARQSRILDAAAQLVRPGGRLVYSTCTFAYAENEGQMESFLQRHPEWRLEPSSPNLAAACDSSQLGIGLRLWPHRHACGGAFAACLRRSEDVDQPILPRYKVREPHLHAATLPTEFGDWGELPDVAVSHNRLQCFAWPVGVPEDFVANAATGPEVAFRKVNTWFPAYALAMRRDARWSPNQRVELDDQQARQFMQGQVLRGGLRGWGVATWQNRPLGWLKGDGRQMKNHLPKAGRIN